MRQELNSLCDPFLGISWGDQLTSEEILASEGAGEGIAEDPSEERKLPWVVTHAMEYGDSRGEDFEVWGVKGDDARVLAFLWRLHDCLPDRGCVIAAQEVIAEWLGKCRQTVSEILKRLVEEGLISWVSGGWWSYKQKLAREVRWVGVGEAEATEPQPEKDVTDWATIKILKRLISAWDNQKGVRHAASTSCEEGPEGQREGRSEEGGVLLLVGDPPPRFGCGREALQ